MASDDHQGPPPAKRRRLVAPIGFRIDDHKHHHRDPKKSTKAGSASTSSTAPPSEALGADPRIEQQLIPYMNIYVMLADQKLLKSVGSVKPFASPSTPIREALVNSALGVLRVLHFLKVFRDIPGFYDDLAGLLGWETWALHKFLGGLSAARKRYKEETSQSAYTGPQDDVYLRAVKVQPLVDKWDSHKSVSWLLTFERMKHYYRFLSRAAFYIDTKPDFLLTQWPKVPVEWLERHEDKTEDWKRVRSKNTRRALQMRRHIEKSLDDEMVERLECDHFPLWKPRPTSFCSDLWETEKKVGQGGGVPASGR